MTLKYRLIFGFVAIAAVMSAFSLVIARKEVVAMRGFDNLVKINSQETYHAARTSMLLQRTKSNLRELIVEAAVGVETDEIIYTLDVVSESLAELEHLSASWLEIVNRDLSHSDDFDEALVEDEREELEELQEVKEQLASFISASRELLSLYQQKPDGLSEMYEFFEHELENPSRQLQLNLQELWDDTQEEAEEESARFIASLEEVFYLALALSGLSILLAGVAGISYSHWITRSLNRVMVGIRSIHKGDYGVTLPIKGDDEIAQLSLALNHLSSQLEANIEAREVAEEQLQMFNQELDAIVENLPAMLFLRDADSLKFVRLNKAGENLLGLSRDQVIGKTVYDLFPHDQASRFSSMDSELVTNRREVVVDLRIDTPAGPRDLHARKIALRDSAGKVRFLLGVATDVTEEKRLRDDLQNLASHDALTGLLNRRVLMEQLNTEVARATRYGNPLSLIMFDADHFKKVNDHYGHQAGDRVLHDLAKVTGQLIRTSDIAGRYGGEEFMLVLPMTDAASAKELAERLRERVAELLIPQVSECDEAISITISLGVASLAGEINTTQELIRAADEALYRAKHEGRNRVCVAHA
ncbi:sensor domain-containing diguanylate cyclase [Marinobacterium sediminicola]|uniref:diguanylate cyclase n=1 Tax=Marinobacterium sediminicola TaxID=518898 RepID=A0ABY1S3X1_9GAMM|nr:GGDEF domain-containing protein [Marinobacterium sediminicola]ULG70184.1 diguanylate cyclase [Marinobacterium sediminicola]SMR78346.1 PAS domain S-box-containing protein/diguanylate cyclase (GGDEF) domain-containing protein [Marinobacterium sediminicola]